MSDLNDTLLLYKYFDYNSDIDFRTKRPSLLNEIVRMEDTDTIIHFIDKIGYDPNSVSTEDIGNIGYHQLIILNTLQCASMSNNLNVIKLLINRYKIDKNIISFINRYHICEDHDFHTSLTLCLQFNKFENIMSI